MCFVLSVFWGFSWGFSWVVCSLLEVGAVNRPHFCFISYSPAAKDTRVFINAMPDCFCDHECLSYLASSSVSLSTPFSYHLSLKLFFCLNSHIVKMRLQIYKSLIITTESFFSLKSSLRWVWQDRSTSFTSIRFCIVVTKQLCCRLGVGGPSFPYVDSDWYLQLLPLCWRTDPLHDYSM